MCFSYGLSGIRDFSKMTPSGRRSTAISRSSHSILRKAGLVNTAAAFPFILRLPKYSVRFSGSLLSPDIHRLSLLQEGPDAFISHAPFLIIVVPAKAGTHNYRPVLLPKASTTLPQ